jgi:hypothetical protein
LIKKDEDNNNGGTFVLSHIQVRDFYDVTTYISFTLTSKTEISATATTEKQKRKTIWPEQQTSKNNSS